jgi:hypothetical protein
VTSVRRIWVFISLLLRVIFERLTIGRFYYVTCR